MRRFLSNSLAVAGTLLAALPVPLAAAEANAGERWPFRANDDLWEGCIAPLGSQGFAQTRTPPSREGAAARLDADRAHHDGRTGVYNLHGDVHLERADQELDAEQLRYEQSTDRADARGNVRYSQTGLRLGADRGYLRLDSNQGELDQARYLIPETLTQGEARRMELVNADVSLAHGTTYSTCEPGSEAWKLRADRIRIDRETGVGEAWHARLTVRDFPVAYSPYVNFPVDGRRKSGFLPPTFGQSERGGTNLRIPYYWNIAPNYDATIAPRFLSERGPMLEGEFRYLRPSFSGEMEGGFLPGDNRFGDDRWLASLDHRHRFPGNLRGQLDLARVSDDQYFRDFGDSLSTSTTRFLRSRGRLNYNTRSLSTELSAEVFQTVDPDIAAANEPYQRLPRLTLGHHPDDGPLGLRWQVDSELVRFGHPEADQRITGTRADFAPRLSRPVVGLAGFLTPAITLRHTRYDLDSADDPFNAELDTTEDETPSRTLPVASLDTGLFFERHFEAFDRPLRQTLEPRLFYLYVPEEDQSDLPLFDTDEEVPGLFQLFSENRFSGPDRIGDANQVTVGLTSRFLSRESGSEFLRLSAGQIQHFDDREVVLRGEPGPEQERDRSNIIGEARLTLPGGLQASTEIQYNPYNDRTDLTRARLSYRPRPDSIFTAGYRARRNMDGDRELEQSDFNVAWPVHPRWHVLGGWNYSLLEGRTLEGFGGLQYRDCCWSVRLLGRYHREDADVEPERSVMVQFELRGLGSIGDDIQSFMEDSIFGYGRRR